MEVMLSIYVPTYNHERYIVQALDSILMQKTKYSYEVLVGEDVSTDGTRAILKEYEKKHPGKFQIFYREQNMSKLPCNNAMDLKLRSKGKYIICLEGDDYWTDEYKIEKQIDFLESHPEYLAVAHNYVIVDENSVPNGEKPCECKDTEYTMDHYMNGIFPGQLTTVMARNYMHGDCFDLSLMNAKIQPGDRRLFFSLITNGKVYCIQEKMSAYRHVVSGGSSYSANYKYDYKKKERFNLALIEYAKKMNKAKALCCAEWLYFKTMMRGVSKRKISPFYLLKQFFKFDNKGTIIGFFIKKSINKRCFLRLK